MRDICMREKIQRVQVILHSDNGSPMTGATMLSDKEAAAMVTELGAIGQ